MTASVIDLGTRQDRRTAQLEIQVQQLRAQLAAVVDAVANETTLNRVLTGPAPSDAEIDELREQVRRHYMRVALLATPKAGQR